jgi:cholest-4-en-3-one 26-monooxygenase
MIDISSPELYEQSGIPHDRFAELRRTEPVAWQSWDCSRGGFWAVTTREDVTTVTRDRHTYSSAGFTNLFELGEEAQAARRSLIDSDAPEHTRLRRLVTPPFTLRRMTNYEQTTRDITNDLLDAMIEQGTGGASFDVVKLLSEPLPIHVIVAILGIPAADADYMVELSSQLVEGTSHHVLDPNAYGNTTPLELLPFNSPASHALFEYGRQLRIERKGCPADDLVTRLIETEVDGDQMTDAEFCNFFQLLVFAGNETTRTAISQGVHLLMTNPDQQERLHADPALIPNAVEEIIRVATPVLHMRRTATVDTELHGVPIATGEWVVMWYASSNFDESVWANSVQFDVGRDPKPDHTSFGAFGPHHCLGAPLARLELRVLLEEVVRRGIRFAAAGSPTRVASNFVHGMLALPATAAGS